MRETHEKEIRAALYARLSRDDNNGNLESMSISNQRDYLLNYAQNQGWNVFDVYTDDGWSGTTFDRPSFNRMIEDIKLGYVNLVVTKDLSRLGRNYVEAGQYRDFFFPQHNVRYIAIDDRYDGDNEDNDIAPFKDILNEMYAKDISKKVRSSRSTSAKQGKFMGSKPPYGYIKSAENKHLLIIDPISADIIRRIFTAFAHGDSGRNIAVRLNADGIDTPAVYYYKQTGKRATNSDNQGWGSSTVMQLLKNQAYIGHMVQGKRQVTSFKTKQRRFTPKDDWIVVENTHEPIVSTEIWELVQKRLEATKHASSKSAIRTNSTGTVSLFSGIIKCADCGSSMAFNKKTNNGNEHIIYRCGRYANNGKDQCSTHTIKMSTLEEVILCDIRHHAKIAITDETSLINRLMKDSNSELEKERTLKRNAMTKHQHRIKNITQMVTQLFEEKVTGSLSDAMFRKMLAEYEKEQADLENQICKLNSDIQAGDNTERNVKSWMSMIKECLLLESLDRETVVRLIKNITVHEKSLIGEKKHQNIAIQYNFVGCLNC